ncbi:hypothetical protein LTR36_002662 [Oleoguttula mirabilis]|uniref:RNase H type-1 domain-containing protein n=1 Tax=Oleoguttula mirabilis TaxID=1507867 RepID=A0AAV9JKK4_9PEZI|nr:hypothetical protein LTR36_002662 [Oleoguttula mirabilis]
MANGEYLHMYTDGSVIDHAWAGCSFVYLEHGNIWQGTSIALGRLPDITMAELHGIDAALFFALNCHEETPVERVDIYTDCKRAVQLIASYKLDGTECVLGKGIVASIEVLESNGIAVSIVWIKGHSDIAGNDEADRLAVMGARESIHRAQQELSGKASQTG